MPWQRSSSVRMWQLILVRSHRRSWTRLDSKYASSSLVRVNAVHVTLATAATPIAAALRQTRRRRRMSENWDRDEISSCSSERYTEYKNDSMCVSDTKRERERDEWKNDLDLQQSESSISANATSSTALYDLADIEIDNNMWHRNLLSRWHNANCCIGCIVSWSEREIDDPVTHRSLPLRHSTPTLLW